MHIDPQKFKERENEYPECELFFITIKNNDKDRKKKEAENFRSYFCSFKKYMKIENGDS